ncbi:MAG: hypothetical protein KIT79_01245 [Deltaproteobacteria bacterium]|nr:hypothetical protein [Deltaproteobacteria bacterium]
MNTLYMRSRLGSLLTFALLLVSLNGTAQPAGPSGDAAITRPSASTHGLLELSGPKPLEPWEFNATLFFNHAGRPSTEFQNAAGTQTFRYLESLSTTHFGAAAGLPFHLSADITFPYHFSSKGEDINGAALSGGTPGDMRIGISWGAQPPGEYEWPVMLRAMVSLPTGDSSRLLGEKLMFFEPQVITGGSSRRLWWTAQAGLRLRKTNRIGDFENGQQVTWGIGAYTPVYRIPLDLGAEWTGAANLSGTTGASGITSVARVQAVYWATLASSVLVYFGGDPGLKGFGAPKYEFGAGIRWSSNPRWRDRDGDGFDDFRDQCPDKAEDFDGFEDHDGCPEPDNDGDRIPDTIDKCPNEPEDYDGWEDEDGCPDPDNDGDGILDADDKCPNDPEDFDGFQDEDGCPDWDNDGDGILDVDDKCPNEPEDRDGFEDKDGCPDPDNDGDGIPDVDDLCPDEPEDFNRFEDHDGCPEGGKPYKPKPKPRPPVTFFGDEDETPASRRPGSPAPVFGTKLVDSPYQFAPGSAELNRGMRELMEDLIILLKSNAELVLIVEVYADPVTPVKERETLVRRRRDSVRDYLLFDRGADPKRVEIVEIAQPQLKGASPTGEVRNIQMYVSLSKP